MNRCLVFSLRCGVFCWIELWPGICGKIAQMVGWGDCVRENRERGFNTMKLPMKVFTLKNFSINLQLGMQIFTKQYIING